MKSVISSHRIRSLTRNNFQKSVIKINDNIETFNAHKELASNDKETNSINGLVRFRGIVWSGKHPSNICSLGMSLFAEVSSMISLVGEMVVGELSVREVSVEKMSVGDVSGNQIFNP